jgi:hypothetical protein
VIRDREFEPPLLQRRVMSKREPRSGAVHSAPCASRSVLIFSAEGSSGLGLTHVALTARDLDASIAFPIGCPDPSDHVSFARWHWWSVSGSLALRLLSPLRVGSKRGRGRSSRVRLIPPDNPVAGAINAIAASPTNPDLVYVGTVNGGVWKTTNATNDSPHWSPLTDRRLPALSIKLLALRPVNSRALFAGTGSTSSFGFDGDPGFGVARSTDAGRTWVVPRMAEREGKYVMSNVARGCSGGGLGLRGISDMVAKSGQRHSCHHARGCRSRTHQRCPR